MTDFLLEILSEEIPARMQARARNDLATIFAEELGKAGLAHGAITAFSTPRRLVLIARELAAETQAVREEIKGPRSSAPPQALEGFLRKTGLAHERLEDRDGVYFAVIDRPGKPAIAVIQEALTRVFADFPWPKSMRWGSGTQRWVRPLQGIVAILGEEIVPFEIAGVTSGATTVGHRFHHPGPITVNGASDYVEKLRACHVIVDHEEREWIIRDGSQAAAEAAGLKLLSDEGLVVENAGLTEWPAPLLGRFDPEFLDVPREVIVLTMRTNQKYFACLIPPRDGEGDHAEHGGGGAEPGSEPPPSGLRPATSGRVGPSGGRTASGRSSRGGLAPAFVCTANIDASDGGEAIVEGNRRVLAARLSDARFFWEQDLKVPLEEQAKKLSGIVFHEKLGTVADKVERVAKLARWLCEEGIVNSSPDRGGGPAAKQTVEGVPSSAPTPLHHPADGPPPRPGEDLADLAERAARLAKADLVTGMVGEFPELQGVIGGYLARAQGEPDAVADAVRDHYKPVGQGDEVPTAPVTVAVSLADKLDTLMALFCVGELPTGSKDPFALRRAALGVIGMIFRNNLRLKLSDALQELRDLVRNQSLVRFSFADADLIGGLLGSDANFDVRETDDGLYLFHGITAVGPVNREYLRSLDDWDAFDETIWAGEDKAADFFIDRFKVQQRDFGVRHDLIDAVFALSSGPYMTREDDLVRLLARVKALQGFVSSDDGRDLHAAYKRASNILKKEDWRGTEGEIARTGEEDPLVGVDDPDLAEVIAAKMSERHEREGQGALPQERALIAALDLAEREAAAAVEREDFGSAMTALSRLRAPIDAFFDHVTVNDPDATNRERRLNLLLRFRDAVHRVADFSKIDG